MLRHDTNNIGQDESAIQGSGNNIMYMGRGRGGRRDLHLCRVNWVVVTVSNECLSCLVFVVTFFLKGVDSFNKLVAGCGVSDSLEDIWDIL